MKSKKPQKEKITTIYHNLIKLQKNYARTYRAMVTEERYENIIASGLLKKYNLNLEIIREPLIEHVGHLPIIASCLHQFIEHKNKVNLGRVLTILSVHDIGETKVGDIISYSKPEAHEKMEDKFAKQILPNYLYKHFQEYHEAKSLDAKFAKAVDAIAPLLHEVVMPELTLARLKHHNFSIEKIIAKKAAYFQWDAVLDELFKYIMEKFRQMEA